MTRYEFLKNRVVPVLNLYKDEYTYEIDRLTSEYYIKQFGYSILVFHSKSYDKSIDTYTKPTTYEFIKYINNMYRYVKINEFLK